MNPLHARILSAAALVTAALVPHGTAAQSAESFYRGKTIKLTVGSSAGGGYDTYARVIARHMGLFIPGKPSMVVQNMPGGSSRAAAKRDSQAGMVWHTAPAQSLQDVLSKEMIVGSSGGATYDFPMLANAILGTKFKIISGYKGTKEIGLAMERGEVQGNAGTTWSSIKTQHPDLLKEKKIRVFVQYSREPHPELPDVPVMLSLAKTEADRQALNLAFARQDFARPYVAPPALPADRTAALRAAFNATMADKAFLDDATKRRLEIAPLKAEDMVALIEDIYKTPKEVVERVQQIVNVDAATQKKKKKKKKKSN